MTDQQNPSDVETEEAFQYWGYLFKKNKAGTEKLNRLLQGIGRYIVRSRFPFSPNQHALIPNFAGRQLRTFR